LQNTEKPCHLQKKSPAQIALKQGNVLFVKMVLLQLVQGHFCANHLSIGILGENNPEGAI